MLCHFRKNKSVLKMHLTETIILLAALKSAFSVYDGCDSIKPCICFKNDNSEVYIDCHDTKLDTEKTCIICGKIGSIRSLDLSHNSLDDLPNNCFENCHILEVLSLENNNISVLRKQVFKGLASLKTLNLDGNRLIQSGVLSNMDAFYPLKTLRIFSIRSNSHATGTTWLNICDVCMIMSNVRQLDFSDNNIHAIPSRCFAACSHLEQLSLASNNLTELNKTSFENTEMLKFLDLDNTGLTPNGILQDPELFQPLLNLRELHVQRNSKVKNDTGCYTYFANIAKNSLENLKILYLDGLPNGVFGSQFINFTHLTHVNFSGESSYCYIFSLSKESFQHTLYLTSLDLSHCNLSSIYRGTFEHLNELTYLNLSFNMALGFSTLRNVSYGLQCTKIEVLDYSKVYKTFGLSTQINGCDGWFLRNTTLKELHLNSNRMAFVGINAFALLPPTIEILTVEDNSLSFGPYVLQGGCLKNLKRIEISFQSIAHSMTNYGSEWMIKENIVDTSRHCKIKKWSSRPNCPYLKPGPIDPWKFSVPRLLNAVNYRSANLRYEKPVYTVPLALKTNVESLDLSGNILLRATDYFVELSNLKLLNLSSNFGIDISSDFFLNVPNLENFDGSNNRIGPKLADDENGTIFQHSLHLKVLNVSNNWIQHLPKNIFIYIEALEDLDLSLNKIEKLDLNFGHMKNLSVMNLQQNKLSTLPLKLMEQLDMFSKLHNKTASIDISGNEIDLSCGNFAFLSWMINHPKYFANIDEYIFRDNGHDKVITYYELLNTFEKFEKGCRTYTSIIVVSSLFITVSISIIIGGIIYRYRWRLRYMYYMTKARYNGYIPVRDRDINMAYKYDVFISYAEEDYQFATGEMYNTLADAGLSMCLHQKDFLPGTWIADNIMNAIKMSRNTLN